MEPARPSYHRQLVSQRRVVGEGIDTAALINHRPQRICVEANFICLAKVCCICH
jgi:hypothetical protein